MFRNVVQLSISLRNCLRQSLWCFWKQSVCLKSHGYLHKTRSLPQRFPWTWSASYFPKETYHRFHNNLWCPKLWPGIICIVHYHSWFRPLYTCPKPIPSITFSPLEIWWSRFVWKNILVYLPTSTPNIHLIHRRICLNSSAFFFM